MRQIEREAEAADARPSRDWKLLHLSEGLVRKQHERIADDTHDEQEELLRLSQDDGHDPPDRSQGSRG